MVSEEPARGHYPRGCTEVTGVAAGLGRQGGPGTRAQGALRFVLRRSPSF